MRLDTFLADQPGVAPDLRDLIATLAATCAQIGATVAQGGLGGVLGSHGRENVQGEVQKKLDVIANDMLLAAFDHSPALAGMASEEMETIHALPHADGRYLLLFDPIDGSSNIDIDLTVGTIFSVLPAPTGRAVVEADFLQPGSRQLAAGYVLYGPQTLLVLTLGDGVHEFTLDRARGIWGHTDGPMRLPHGTAEFAINMSNRRQWSPAVAGFIDARVAGSEGPLGRDYNMRWTASLVAEVQRILKRGGVFLYPADSRTPGKARLRLMYEANPMAMIMAQAGGAASDGVDAILDVMPVALHQRVGLVLGDPAEVAAAG